MTKFQAVVMMVGLFTACKKESGAPAVAGSGSVAAVAPGSGSAGSAKAATATAPGVDTPVDGPALNVPGEVEGVAVRHKPPRHVVHLTGTHPKEKLKVELFAKMGESACNPDSSISLKLIDKDDVRLDAFSFFPKDPADWTKDERVWELPPGDYAVKLEVECAMGAPTMPTSNPYKIRTSLVTQ